MSEKNSRHIPAQDNDLLWRLSAFRCAHPNCKKELYKRKDGDDRIANIGERAHIFSHSTFGPRPNPDGFTEDTNKYENLILLCRNHHAEVDQQPNSHSVTVLRNWKTDHETWIADRLAIEKFNSADLESMIFWLTENENPRPVDFMLTPPAEKIKKNGFSVGIQKLIDIGLLRTHEVETFIVAQSQLYGDYPTQLLGPLLTRYDIFRVDSQSANHVFHDLVQFACGNSRDHIKWLAGIVLIVYFFERCDIFEK